MDAQKIKRKLAAIVSADVEGYTRLMGNNETDTVRTLTAYKEAITVPFKKQSDLERHPNDLRRAGLK